MRSDGPGPAGRTHDDRAKKLLAASLVLATGVMGIAACSSSGGGQSSGGKVTMTFWHNSTTGAGKAFWEKTVGRLRGRQPRTSRSRSSPSRTRTWTASSRPRSTPATPPTSSCSAAAARWPAMVKAGQLHGPHRLDHRRDQDGDSARRRSRPQTIDGKVYAMPRRRAARRHLLQQGPVRRRPASPQPPTTLDELEAAVDKLKAAGIAPDRPRRQGRLAGRALVLLLRAARVQLRTPSTETAEDAELRRPLLAEGRRGPAELRRHRSRSTTAS